MNSIKFAILVFIFSLCTSGVMAQSDPASDPNTKRNATEPVDAHSPFPTQKGMNTQDTLFKASDGKTKAASNKLITTKHAKVPSSGNGTDILNDRRDTTEIIQEKH